MNKPILHLFFILFTALLLRVFFWTLLPENHFVTDEGVYFQGGINIVQGAANYFFPPLVQLIVAILYSIFDTNNVEVFRLFWVFLDVLNVALVYSISKCVFRSHQVACLSSLFYALYLPALGFSVTVTSEVPSVLLVLSSLLLILKYGWKNSLVCMVVGLLCGLLILARTNMLLIIPSFSLVAYYFYRASFRNIVLFIGVSSSVLFSFITYNGVMNNSWEIASNSSFNLYVGNRENYSEDLNLFNPFATDAQKADRKRGGYQVEELTDRQMRDQAVDYILQHPLVFIQRAIGRLARVFVPKTSAIKVIGGEKSGSVFRGAALLILGGSLLQWMFVLSFGSLKVFNDLVARKVEAWTFSFYILSSVALCLIAISKPRYSFMFDPILIIYASSAILNFKHEWKTFLSNPYKYYFVFFTVFILWAWIAWFIFTLSSRL
ncbi:MAG: hypothetical protein KAG18_03750 [Sinobacterium sp.]|nr:hypothetical protein [Sinobacterium sp.]